MRGEVMSSEAAAEPVDDSENEEKGVSGLEEGADRSSSPRPCGCEGRTTNSDMDTAGDDGAGVGRAGETITGGESDRAWAS
jgi:hypothetical protein